MDTEFPGVVAKPSGCFKSTEELEYQSMRCNVDILKIIQIGITLGNSKGEVPSPVCTWQFNFKFNIEKDPHFGRAITLLQQSGIDFSKFNEEGIDVYDFGRFVLTSGLVMNNEITWITFHSISDFGYLLKALTSSPLPSDNQSFFKMLHIYFPHFYDIKYYTSCFPNIANGLQGIADQYSVERVGKEHQAGSDSFVTYKVFIELQTQVFHKNIQNMDVENKLYGASTPPVLL
ncbi:CCR4-NOT transcription complex subunit 7 [Histomonas meleagridis]|uniref:CCR4-NOT transcription complex subunit 7 n=1 Tax=Histomonas meleagridis TaxID=135588 RepID=UPI003559E119|nr:CCR4-NOT transcription complex subunit 7 [Histomonas meleagridis]